MKPFFSYFESVYSISRWSLLGEALKRQEAKVGFHEVFQNEREQIHPDLLKKLSKTINQDTQEKDYFLDPASVLVPLSLSVQPGHHVLDMCAAPGGKSLILGKCLQGEGQLISCEPSPERRQRLKGVLRSYLSEEELKPVTVSGRKGEVWGRAEPEKFERILLDAPCSGERHLLMDHPQDPKWTEASAKRNAMRQFSLLCSGWDALAPGGRLVYSTCSMNPKENDHVIAKLIDRRPDVEIITPEQIWGEKTECGQIILPDFHIGWGPMYWSILMKKA